MSAQFLFWQSVEKGTVFKANNCVTLWKIKWSGHTGLWKRFSQYLVEFRESIYESSKNTVVILPAYPPTLVGYDSGNPSQRLHRSFWKLKRLPVLLIGKILSFIHLAYHS